MSTRRYTWQMQYQRYSTRLKVCALMPLMAIMIGCSISTIEDKHPSKNPVQTQAPELGLICKDASDYLNQVVGDGHCIALIKRCAGAPNTNLWRPGPRVLNSKLRPGTIIATFEGQRYTNQTGQHAAVYIEHNDQGIWVWDQWRGTPVHKRLIRVRYDGANASNTAQAYRIVQISDQD